jgi:succinate dehydrogenase / fumarate reductase cytochrome b subunit
MSAAQGVFLVGLSLVLLIVLGYTVVVLQDAARSGSGSFVTRDFIRRFGRSPAERAEADRWAFYAHRLTGFAIFGFLMLHLMDVGLYAVSRHRYDDVHRIYGSVVLRVFECGLLFAILFHTFNGLRLLGIDLADLGVTASRRLLLIAVALTLLVGLAGSVVILKPIVT